MTPVVVNPACLTSISVDGCRGVFKSSGHGCFSLLLKLTISRRTSKLCSQNPSISYMPRYVLDRSLGLASRGVLLSNLYRPRTIAPNHGLGDRPPPFQKFRLLWFGAYARNIVALAHEVMDSFARIPFARGSGSISCPGMLDFTPCAFAFPSGTATTRISFKVYLNLV